jgi:large subunit ribosomal protein L13
MSPRRRCHQWRANDRPRSKRAALHFAHLSQKAKSHLTPTAGPLASRSHFPGKPDGDFLLIEIMKTFSAKAQDVQRKWWVIDAENQVLGKIAVAAAQLLRGKKKAIFTPHVDTGDHVVIINAEKAVLTGKKEEQKEYRTFSGYVGGHHTRTAAEMRAKNPQRMVEHAVKGMIPHNRLGNKVYKKLHVYKGPAHEHIAQQPQPFTAL